MQIKIKQLKKTTEVKASIKNLKKTYAVNLKIAKLEDQEVEGIEGIEGIIEMQNSVVNYISDIMKLSEKEIDNLEELELDDVIEIFSYISARLMGGSDSDISKAKENGEVGLAPESE